MTVSVSALKSAMWFAAVLLLVVSFPLQVYFNSPFPSLLPYVLVGLVLLLTWAIPRVRADRAEVHRRKTMDTIIAIYGLLVVFNTAWQTAFGVVAPEEAGTAFVNYLLPVVFYLYFARVATEREIRAVLLAAVIGGLIAGLYFTYDSYSKIALGQVRDYSRRAFDYSLGRAGPGAGELSETRIAANYRSFGLLENHAVSGAWVIIGALAALALVPEQRRALRRVVVLAFAAMLLIGLNFTAIVAFAIIMLVFEFGGLTLLRGRLSVRLVGQLAWLAIMLLVLIGGAFWVVGDVMSQFIVANLRGQSNLALGTGGADLTMSGILLRNIAGYAHHIVEYPVTLLLGDGVTSYGIRKGGDIGLVESLAKFGLPAFLLILLGFSNLIRKGLVAINDRGEMSRYAQSPERRWISFAVAMILLVIITEGHYTVWAAKSILPIVFFALAVLSRYLPRSPGAKALPAGAYTRHR